MNIPLIPLVNGKSYEWANIIANILGVPINGFTSIEYGNKRDMQNVYGAGSEPVSRVYGKNEPFAKITLTMEEVENIQAVAPLGDLTRIPEFDISVIYLDDSLATVTHKIRNVRFMNNDRKSKTGDGAIEVELELITSHIEWQ
jgi:hypothetical protein